MEGKPESEGVSKGGFQLEVTWAEGPNLEPVFVDNLHMAQVNNQYYLTFGQLRVPVGSTRRGEIHPMACFVLSRESITRLVDLLGKVAEKKP